jgi:hypothetical protein
MESYRNSVHEFQVKTQRAVNRDTHLKIIALLDTKKWDVHAETKQGRLTFVATRRIV